MQKGKRIIVVWPTPWVRKLRKKDPTGSASADALYRFTKKLEEKGWRENCPSPTFWFFQKNGRMLYLFF